MRFAAALGTIDEVDLLPSVIEQLRRIGFSEIFVLDYGSTDGTLEYLREEERRGDIWVLHPRPTDDYWTWDTIQWRITSDPEIDYVLFLDSDELLLPAGGTLESMDLEGYDVVTIPRYNVVLQPTGPAVPLDDPSRSLSDTLVWARPMSDPFRRLRDDPDMPWIRGQLEPKVLARPSAIRGIQPGFHGIVTDPRARVRSAYAADAIIAHVPIRTFERFERKVANYRATVEAFPEWYEGGQGWQWVRWLRVFDEGRIQAVVGSDVIIERLPGYPTEYLLAGPGDSGAVWVDASTLAPVALHKRETAVGPHQALATDFGTVLTALHLQQP